MQIINIKQFSVAMLSITLLLMSFSVHASSTVGKVIIYSGIVAAKSIDGKVRVLSRKSKVFKKDVVTTEQDSYARIRFTDGSLLVMRPSSTISIDEYYFDKNRPKKDKAVINLLEGGLRTITGLIGKRGNKDSYKTKTRHSSIGIRGTVYGVLMCHGQSCAGLSDGHRPEKDGQYVNVSSGAIVIKNSTGTTSINAGQFAFVPSINSAVMIIPKDPGSIRFVSPEATNSSRPAKPGHQGPQDFSCQM